MEHEVDLLTVLRNSCSMFNDRSPVSSVFLMLLLSCWSLVDLICFNRCLRWLPLWMVLSTSSLSRYIHVNVIFGLLDRVYNTPFLFCTAVTVHLFSHVFQLIHYFLWGVAMLLLFPLVFYRI